MGLRQMFGDQAIPSAARGAGTVVSGPIAAAGQAADVVVFVHASASSGTPTLNVSLEESATGESAWTAIPGSGIAQLSGAGNASANAVASKPFVRVTATVAGTTPNITYRAAVGIFTE